MKYIEIVEAERELPPLSKTVIRDKVLSMLGATRVGSSIGGALHEQSVRKSSSRVDDVAELTTGEH